MGIREAVDRFGRTSAERGLAVHGLVVAQGGAAAVEERWDVDLRRDVFSASKTVTALAVGIAEAEGLLSLLSARPSGGWGRRRRSAVRRCHPSARR